MDHEQTRELIEPYALDALDPDERLIVERHVAECTDCRRLANEYSKIAHSLPQALANASPHRLPSAAKDRLLQSLRAPSGKLPLRDPSPNALVGAQHAVPLRGWLRPRTIGALAAGLLLVLSLAWNLGSSVALARERALRAEFASLVDQQEIVLEVVDGRNTVKAQLRATQSGSPSYGKLYTRPDLPHVVVMAARLPQPPEGQAYHLWLTSQGQMRLIGIMPVNDQGFGLLVFDADSNAPVFDAAQLTLQPEGASAPDGPVLLWQTSN